MLAAAGKNEMEWCHPTDFPPYRFSPIPQIYYTSNLHCYYKET